MALLPGERDRLRRLLQAWLDAGERGRQDFAVLEIESPLTLQFAGFALRFRQDRVDRLADGSVAIIDYKTGTTVALGKWFDARPQAPQLGVYLLARRAAYPEQAVGAVAYARGWHRTRWAGSGSPPMPTGCRRCRRRRARPWGALADWAAVAAAGRRASARWRRRSPPVWPWSGRATPAAPAGGADCSRCAGSTASMRMRWARQAMSAEAPADPRRLAEEDDRARAQALDVNRSFLVQAPAGSGKTELLIQRYLALLANVDRPEAIVAMTFTRKAAGEMRERILLALRDAAAGVPVEGTHFRRTRELAQQALAQDARQQWQLTAHPARLTIVTIDAYCAGLAGQAPLTAKLGGFPRYVDRPEALYRQAAHEALADAPAADPHWRALLAHLDNDAARLVISLRGCSPSASSGCRCCCRAPTRRGPRWKRRSRRRSRASLPSRRPPVRRRGSPDWCRSSVVRPTTWATTRVRQRCGAARRPAAGPLRWPLRSATGRRSPTGCWSGNTRAFAWRSTSGAGFRHRDAGRVPRIARRRRRR